jgi:hypothetical protein
MAGTPSRKRHSFIARPRSSEASCLRRAVNQLTDGITPRSLLEAPVGVDAAAEQAWFESLLRWLLDRDRLARISAPNRSWRLQVLSTALEQHPQRDALLQRLGAVWKHSSAVRLLAEMGLPDQTSFVKEAAQRLTDRLVPRLDPHEDLYALVERLNLTEADAHWLESLPQDARRLWSGIFEPSAQSLRTTIELLALRAAALGLSRELLLRLPGASEFDSPFLTLPQAASELVRHPDDPARRDAWAANRASCERAINATQARLDEHGVSVELVFRLDLVRATLARADELMKLAHRAHGRTLHREQQSRVVGHAAVGQRWWCTHLGYGLLEIRTACLAARTWPAGRGHGAELFTQLHRAAVARVQPGLEAARDDWFGAGDRARPEEWLGRRD